jgi:hypothetical protein
MAEFVLASQLPICVEKSESDRAALGALSVEGIAVTELDEN